MHFNSVSLLKEISLLLGEFPKYALLVYKLGVINYISLNSNIRLINFSKLDFNWVCGIEV